MSQSFEIDLDTERVQLDGEWLTSDELSGRIAQMLAARDFRISRQSEALEQLARAAADARSVTLKLSAEHFARLEAAGERLGKSAAAFARDLLAQVLAGQPAAQPPVVAVTAGEPEPLTISPKRAKNAEPPVLA